MTKPAELQRAEKLLGLCERFGKLPSQILAEDAQLIRLLALEALGRKGPYQE